MTDAPALSRIAVNGVELALLQHTTASLADLVAAHAFHTA